MSKRVTQKEVAKRAGVSYQTVSRVINNKGEVAPETRARVLDAIQALDYQPPGSSRKQIAQKLDVIGVVIPYNPDLLFADPHLLQVIHGIDRQITLRDYSLLLSTPRATDGVQSAYRRLLDKNFIDGVIVESGLGDSGERLFHARGYPLVVVGYTDPDLPCVHPDDEGGAYMLTQHLLALSHRRIAVIYGPNSKAMAARWHGYERAHADAGLSYNPNLRVNGDFTTQSGYEATAHLMQRTDAPTAIFAFNDRMAMGAIHWLREHHIAVPEEVSVAGFDDIANAELCTPSLTTVRIFSADIGQRAATLLFDLMDERSTTTHIVLPTQLVVRQSTAVAIR